MAGASTPMATRVAITPRRASLPLHWAASHAAALPATVGELLAHLKALPAWDGTEQDQAWQVPVTATGLDGPGSERLAQVESGFSRFDVDPNGSWIPEIATGRSTLIDPALVVSTGQEHLRLDALAHYVRLFAADPQAAADGVPASPLHVWRTDRTRWDPEPWYGPEDPFVVDYRLGGWHVMDGNHRVAAARLLRLPQLLVWAVVPRLRP